MRKNEYLKLCLKTKVVRDLDWIYSAFSVTRSEDEKSKDYHLRLSSYPWGYSFYDENKDEMVKIEDSVSGTPLFRWREKQTFNVSDIPNLKSTTDVEIGLGNVLFNSICVLPHFGTKMEMITGKLDIRSIESYIAGILQDTPEGDAPRSDKYIYCDEYIGFRDSLLFLESLSNIVSWSATKKLITKPPTMDKVKKELQEKYGVENLKDPIVLAQYEGDLKALDKEWLKDDPAYGTFIKGKILDISRKKMFIGIGSEEKMDSNDETVPILASLEEGIPTDPKEFTAIVNGARSGSFSRGTETINGGVVAKAVIRVGSNYVIGDDDCGASMGLVDTFYDDNISSLVGNSIIINKKSVYIENKEQAGNYLGRAITLRSPLYCKRAEDSLCKICAGSGMSQFKEGLIIPLTEVSNIILTASLKSMHGTVLATEEIDVMRVTS